MLKVVILDANASQENPIKPIEKVVDSDKLPKLIEESLNDHTYCIVSVIETY